MVRRHTSHAEKGGLYGPRTAEKQAGTAGATAGGLALIVFARNRALRALGVVALLAPHLIGAPQPIAGEHGPVPAELASHFVVWTLATAALFWAVLGAACGDFYRRFA